jgi:pimeloyl-ACP methyl ester carboxylesterase
LFEKLYYKIIFIFQKILNRWDELGKYDIPNSIDYVLNVTGQEKLAAYFGYSLGCSAFFMSASQFPRINDQVDVMVGIGPTVSVGHLNNYFRYMAPFVNIYQVRIIIRFILFREISFEYFFFGCNSYFNVYSASEKFTQTMESYTLSLA